MVAGEAPLPGTAAGYRPASRPAAAPGQQQPFAGTASLPEQAPLRQLQHQQGRLTPLALPGSKQQHAAAAGTMLAPPARLGQLAPEEQQQQVGRSASEPAAASGLGQGLEQQQQQQQQQAGQQVQEELGEGGGSPLEAAEPSQQLGLSPGAAAEAAAAAAAGPAWQGAGGAGASAGPTPLAAATPAAPPGPGAAAVSSRRLHSGHAEEWGQLLRHAKLLVREMEQSDRSNLAFRPGITVATVEQADVRYQQAVSGKCPPWASTPNLSWCMVSGLPTFLHGGNWKLADSGSSWVVPLPAVCCQHGCSGGNTGGGEQVPDPAAGGQEVSCGASPVLAC